MAYGAIDYKWVLAASVASFAFGAVYYGILSKPWQEASGRTVDPGYKGPPPGILAITFLAEVVIAWTMAGVLVHLAKAGVAPTLRNGAVSAAFVWFGFVLAPLLVNNLYQNAKRMLTVIDAAHWLGVLLIQGAIVGALAIT